MHYLFIGQFSSLEFKRACSYDFLENEFLFFREQCIFIYMMVILNAI